MIIRSVWLILLNGIFSVCSANLPCHYFESINITNGVVQTQNTEQGIQDRNSIIFDGIEFRSSQYSIVDYTEDDGMRNFTEPHIRGCFCEIKPCHRLCCSNEQININNDTIKILDHKCNEELSQIEEEIYDESSKFINLVLGHTIINFDNKKCLSIFVEKDYMNVKYIGYFFKSSP